MSMKFKAFTRYLLPVLLLLLACSSITWGQSLGDTISSFGPGNCAPNVSANYVVGAAAGVGSVPSAVGTAFTPVAQAASSAAATDIIGCDVTPGMSRTSSGKGATAVAGVAIFYGIITTAATSESAPTCVRLTMPSPAAAETASVAAGTAITLTSIPVIGSANLTAVTTGQFYTTYLAFTTPPAFNGPYGKLQCAVTFVQGAAAAMVVNSPGGLIFYTNTITWMKKHGHDASVDALMREGISRQTSELIYAHYVPKDRKAMAYMAAYQHRNDSVVAGCHIPPLTGCDPGDGGGGSGGSAPPGIADLISYGPTRGYLQ